MQSLLPEPGFLLGKQQKMDGIANMSVNASQTPWLHKGRVVHGMSPASLLPMALCAQLDLVLCKRLFIPCWVQTDPVPLFFVVNVRVFKKLCMISAGNED